MFNLQKKKKKSQDLAFENGHVSLRNERKMSLLLPVQNNNKDSLSHFLTLRAKEGRIDS